MNKRQGIWEMSLCKLNGNILNTACPSNVWSPQRIENKCITCAYNYSLNMHTSHLNEEPDKQQQQMVRISKRERKTKNSNKNHTISKIQEIRNHEHITETCRF